MQDEAVSRWMFQKPSFTSNLENTLAALNLSVISSRVGALYCSQMIALLRSLRLKQIQKEPSGFQGYVRDDIHSIGSVTEVIMPWSTMSCRSFSMASLHSMGTLHIACCTGGRKGQGR